MLRILEGAQTPLAQQEIAKQLLVSRANVTGLIDKLEAEGLVQRGSTEDRRVKLIHLTDRGWTFLQESFEEVLEKCRVHLASLSTTEQAELLRLTSKLIEGNE